MVFLGCVGLYTYTNTLKTKINVNFKRTEKNIFLIGQIKELSKKYTTTFYLPFRFMEMAMASKLETPPYLKMDDDELILKNGEKLDIGTEFLN